MSQPDATLTFATYLDGETIRVRAVLLQPGKEPVMAPIRTDALAAIAINATQVFCDLRGIGKL